MNFNQGVHGVAFSVRPDGIRDYVDADGNISREQDVTTILKLNAADRDRDRFKGFRLAPERRKVASIPLAVVDIAKAQGLDILGKWSDMVKFLNDPANRAWRTTNEVV